jgi:hypothetical protein
MERKTKDFENFNKATWNKVWAWLLSGKTSLSVG